jgi:hypothetical protein
MKPTRLPFAFTPPPSPILPHQAAFGLLETIRPGSNIYAHIPEKFGAVIRHKLKILSRTRSTRSTKRTGEKEHRSISTTT